MSERMILWLTVGAIVVFIIGFIMVLNGSSDIGGWLALGAGLASLIPWIAAIIKVIRTQKWGWFVGLLVFGILGSIAYGISGPEEQFA